LTHSIAVALPVAVVFLPKLSVAATADWLAKKHAGCISSTPDRALRGCLVAQRGHGFIFVDGSLDEGEQRVTLAHETGHFLQHYEAPRAEALQLLGPSIAPVLDGDRPPTSHERLRGALRGAPIGVYEHMLDRHDGVPGPTTASLEAEADLIAFELLAPTSVILRTTKPGLDCRDALVARYGLPTWAAARWAGWIDGRRVRDGFLRRLEGAREKNDR
jgi:hypothetical protein